MPTIKVEGKNIFTTKKDGTPWRDGNVRMGIKTTDKNGEEQWINGFVSKEVADAIQVGQEVEANIESTEFGLQFELIGEIETPFKKLEKRVTVLEQQRGNGVSSEPMPTTKSNPEEYPNF